MCPVGGPWGGLLPQKVSQRPRLQQVTLLLPPVPQQVRQRVHQILNMRGSSIKIVRHILKGELG